MQICNYYLGRTDKITGFLYDTDTKTYRSFIIKPEDWDPTKLVVPGDVEYFFPTLESMKRCLNKIKTLGFTEDNTIRLDFKQFML